MQHSAQSHTGLVRSENQDRFLILDLDPGHALGIVSDGLGGEAGGGLASDLVVKTMAAFESGPNPKQELDRLVRLASDKILGLAQESPDLVGMGATAVAALVGPGQVHWTNLGDSRLYHFSGNGLRQVSRDHSFLQELLEAGDLTPEEAREHPLRHALDQCAGTPEARPDTGTFAAQPGDLVLLCSDGLYNQMNDDRMRDILAQGDSLEKRSQALLDEALSTGAPDNVTVALLEVPA